MHTKVIESLFTDLLAKAADLDGTARDIIRLLESLWEADTVQLFSLSGNDLILLASSGENPVENTLSLARSCVDRMQEENEGGLSAVPLAVSGAVVGALVFSSPPDKKLPALDAFCNLAALIVQASGGRGIRILNPVQFLSVINQERNRSSRSREPFAVISISNVDGQPIAPPAIQPLCRWIRSFDVAGLLDRHQAGVLLPMTARIGARIAAYRLRDLFWSHLKMPMQIRFLTFSSEDLRDPGTRPGENEDPLKFEEHLWTSVPAAC